MIFYNKNNELRPTRNKITLREFVFYRKKTVKSKPNTQINKINIKGSAGFREADYEIPDW